MNAVNPRVNEYQTAQAANVLVGATTALKVVERKLRQNRRRFFHGQAEWENPTDATKPRNTGVQP